MISYKALAIILLMLSAANILGIAAVDERNEIGPVLGIDIVVVAMSLVFLIVT